MPSAIHEISPQLQTGIKSFVTRRVQDSAAAEDIVQNIFLRIHRRLDTLKDDRRIAAWLFQIARHAIIDYYRAPQRHKEVPLGLASELEAMHRPTTTAPEGDQPEPRQELAACLRPMMEQLAEPYRQALMLVELEGVTQAAAAKQLGLSSSGMKSRVQRGRQQLKRMLEECCVIRLDRRQGVASYTQRRSGCDPCQ
jgi:RNA polymerase sigma-70 factor, ECF subfamily